jgi:hypothetical protein
MNNNVKDIIVKLNNEIESINSDHHAILNKIIARTQIVNDNRKEVISLTANKKGLLKLALLLIEIANTKRKVHYHLDEFDGRLEEGSEELRITKEAE